jgi:hypothetical protein
VPQPDRLRCIETLRHARLLREYIPWLLFGVFRHQFIKMLLGRIRHAETLIPSVPLQDEEYLSEKNLSEPAIRRNGVRHCT